MSQSNDKRATRGQLLLGILLSFGIPVSWLIESNLIHAWINGPVSAAFDATVPYLLPLAYIIAVVVISRRMRRPRVLIGFILGVALQILLISACFMIVFLTFR